jgi:hypothetical protein
MLECEVVTPMTVAPVVLEGQLVRLETVTSLELV